jgi:hypothetical protein
MESSGHEIESGGHLMESGGHEIARDIPAGREGICRPLGAVWGSGLAYLSCLLWVREGQGYIFDSAEKPPVFGSARDALKKRSKTLRTNGV